MNVSLKSCAALQPRPKRFDIPHDLGGLKAEEVYEVLAPVGIQVAAGLDARLAC